MKEGEDQQSQQLREDGQSPSSQVNDQDLFPGAEKMAPEELKEYLDDLFRGYILGKG